MKLLGLKATRERNFLSQRELAERAGVGRATIARLETGDVEPQPRTVRKLAEALAVEPSELVMAPEEKSTLAA